MYVDIAKKITKQLPLESFIMVLQVHMYIVYTTSSDYQYIYIILLSYSYIYTQLDLRREQWAEDDGLRLVN